MGIRSSSLTVSLFIGLFVLSSPGFAGSEDTCGWPVNPDSCTHAIGAPFDTPLWSLGRDRNGSLQTCADDPSDGCDEPIAFEARKETSCVGGTAFGHPEWNPNRGFGRNRNCGRGGVGWFMPRSERGTSGFHTLIWRVGLDSYNGVAVGQNQCGPGGVNTCSECCPNCADLAQGPWGGAFKNILFKSFDFRGALKCASTQHDDVLQAPSGGQEIDGWIVFQDGYLVNADSHVSNFKGLNNSVDGPLKGIVYQNVAYGIEQDYIDDCENRGVITGCGRGGNPLRPNDAWLTIWMIKLEFYGVASRRHFGTATGSGGYKKIIAIKTPPSEYSLEAGVPRPVEYASIEAAVAAGEELPPFLWASCEGWANPPDNCVNSRGVDEAIRGSGQMRRPEAPILLESSLRLPAPDQP